RGLGLAGVGTVDEDDAGEAEELTEAGNVGGLHLGDAGEAAAQKSHRDDGVELALVIEEEDARPGRPQVLRAAHNADVDPREREAELRSDVAADLDERLARAAQQA